MFEVNHIVKVVSKASYKHYGKFGRIIKKCNSKWKSMYEVYFDDEKSTARFYETSLERIR